jgi:DNA-binding response OmpR family regulator
MSRHVLIIEDNQELADLIALHVRDLDCEVSLAGDGEVGLSRAREGSWDLIILDLMLPGLGGLDICRKLREAPGYTPIIMVTAKSSELDRVLGLELGADDYITKPFSIPELLARVKAMFRRVEALADTSDSGPQQINVGALSIELAKRRASVRGQPVSLTAKEFDLLAHFARNPGRVYTRAQLLDQVWGESYSGYEHTVNSHINRLRRKIETDSARPDYLLTVWGVGYKLNDAVV